MISLAKGDLELDITPDVGAAVTRFTCRGRDVLRRAPAGAANALEMGCFPLVPYANRIENGQLRFEGRTYQLPLNFGSHPHSLHGHGWQTAWRVVSVSRDEAALSFDHAADEWPWSYAAEEVVSLGQDGARFHLKIRSRDSRPMPFSLGFHPYFPRTAGSRLTASVAGMWLSDDSMLPIEHITKGLPIDLPKGVVVAKAPFVDNAFTGWRSPAVIEQPDSGLTVSLEASAACGFLHVFMPVGEGFFCAEPVTAMPNAFNRSEAAAVTGGRVLPAGAEFSIEMHIGVRNR